MHSKLLASEFSLHGSGIVFLICCTTPNQGLGQGRQEHCTAAFENTVVAKRNSMASLLNHFRTALLIF